MNAATTKKIATEYLTALKEWDELDDLDKYDYDGAHEYSSMRVEQLADDNGWDLDKVWSMLERLMTNDSPCWKCGSDLAPHTIVWYEGWGSDCYYSHEACIK